MWEVQLCEKTHTSCFPSLSSANQVPETHSQGPSLKKAGPGCWHPQEWQHAWFRHSPPRNTPIRLASSRSKDTGSEMEGGRSWSRPGICLEMLPVPSLNPEHLGQVRACPSSDSSWHHWRYLCDEPLHCTYRNALAVTHKAKPGQN